MGREPPEILQTCRLFAEVGQVGREELGAMSVWRDYRKGEVIFRQGDEAAGIFIVASGMARIYKIAPNGKEHVLHLAVRGDTFAEVAVIGRFPCPANAEAVEGTNCLLLPSVALRAALTQSHELCLQLLAGMSGWVRQLVGLMEGIVLRDAVSRVARYLIEAGRDGDLKVQLPGRKRDIASHLNMTSESLSRALRHLREIGLVQDDPDGSLKVLDEEKLRAGAEGLLPEL